jgi:hypothetical protein
MEDVADAALLHACNTRPDLGITLIPGDISNALSADVLREFLVASSLLMQLVGYCTHLEGRAALALDNHRSE